MQSKARDNYREAVGFYINNINNDKIITTTCKFHFKSNNQLKARLTSRGYQQVPGIDYKEVSSPVLSKSLRRLLITMAKIYKNLFIQLI
jgi:hypothetical protein